MKNWIDLQKSQGLVFDIVDVFEAVRFDDFDYLSFFISLDKRIEVIIFFNNFFSQELSLFVLRIRFLRELFRLVFLVMSFLVLQTSWDYSQSSCMMLSRGYQRVEKTLYLSKLEYRNQHSTFQKKKILQ